MDFLKPAVDRAFTMSTIAAKQLGNPAQMNTRVSRLAGYIFGDTWPYHDVIGNYFRLFKTQSCGLANEYQGPFSRISKYGQDDKGSSDILIYCDQTRIQQNPEGRWVDTINIFTYSRNTGSEAVNTCEKGGIAAHTTTTLDGTVLMQLCPGYMKSQEENFGNEIFVYLTRHGALRTVRELSTNPDHPILSTWPDPLIEYFALLDYAILHEVCITALSCTD
jgi:hypothetical protein